MLLVALGFASNARAAFADPHLPIIDVVPEATWAGSSGSVAQPTAGGSPAGGALVSGPITLNGTATLPLFKGLSFSYDRINGDVFYNTLAVTAGINPGLFDDVIENYRLDYELNKSISLELANSTRQRICCPASSVTGIDWHIGSFGITYATPYLKPLHGLFVLNATGHANYHNPGPVVAASWAGLDRTCASVTLGVAGAPTTCHGYKATTFLETSEAATFVLPLDPRNGLGTTATYLTGAGDYFTAFPFPFRLNVTIFGAEKHFTPNVSLKLGAANVWQVSQGSPFPSSPANPRGGSIHLVSYTAALDFHVDLNRLVGPHAKH
ncbi:MAG: hypothetical protein IAI48_13450 [Candidatus Eremiobacteraeota bacterium]|nr:hypothetical protein [Candidatus Eremiobacteraeota bacterium]